MTIVSYLFTPEIINHVCEDKWPYEQLIILGPRESFKDDTLRVVATAELVVRRAEEGMKKIEAWPKGTPNKKPLLAQCRAIFKEAVESKKKIEVSTGLTWEVSSVKKPTPIAFEDLLPDAPEPIDSLLSENSWVMV